MKLIDLISILGAGYEMVVFNKGEVISTSHVMRHGIEKELENKDFSALIILDPMKKRIQLEVYDSNLPRSGITIKQLMPNIIPFTVNSKLCIVDESSYIHKPLWIGHFCDFMSNNDSSIGKKEKLFIDSLIITSLAFYEEYIYISVNNTTYD